MATKGPLYPTSASDSGIQGTFTWNDPLNALSSNDARSITQTLSDPGDTTHSLSLVFPSFEVPSGATIDGIVVEIECYKSNTSVTCYCDLYYNDQPLEGTPANKTFTPPTGSASEAYVTLGSSTDKWNRTTLSAENVNSGLFGIGIWVVSSTTNNRTVGVDTARVTVYYTKDWDIGSVSGSLSSSAASKSISASTASLAGHLLSVDYTTSTVEPDQTPRTTLRGLGYAAAYQVQSPEFTTETLGGSIESADGTKAISYTSSTLDGQISASEGSADRPTTALTLSGAFSENEKGASSLSHAVIGVTGVVLSVEYSTSKNSVVSTLSGTVSTVTHSTERFAATGSLAGSTDSIPTYTRHTWHSCSQISGPLGTTTYFAPSEVEYTRLTGSGYAGIMFGDFYDKDIGQFSTAATLTGFRLGNDYSIGGERANTRLTSIGYAGILFGEFEGKAQGVYYTTSTLCGVRNSSVGAGTPEVTSISPISGVSTGGTFVTVTGRFFDSSTVIYFGGAPGTGTIFNSSTAVTCYTPAHTPGTVPVRAENGTNVGQEAYGLYEFTGSDLLPVIDSISPSTGSAGGGTAVDIYGDNFVSGCTVSFGGVAATAIVFFDSTHVQAQTPAGNGTVDVQVTNPDLTSAVLPAAFTYSGVQHTIQTRNGFILSSTGKKSIAYTSRSICSSIETVSDSIAKSASTSTEIGSRISNQFLNSTTVASSAETYCDAVLENTSAKAIGYTSRLLSGVALSTEFSTAKYWATASVIGNVSENVSRKSVESSVETVAGNVSSSSITSAGQVETRLTGLGYAGIQWGEFTGKEFGTYYDVSQRFGARLSNDAYATPTITLVSPVSGTDAGGTSVTITGSHFNSSTLIYFGGAPATSIVCVDSQTITCVTPAHTSGAVPVRADNGPISSGETYGLYEYTGVDLPVVDSVTPSTGVSTGGTGVVIEGSGFDTVNPGTQVKFGENAATVVIVASATQISCTTPAGSGTVDVQVINPNGTSGFLPLGFTYTGYQNTTRIGPRLSNSHSKSIAYASSYRCGAVCSNSEITSRTQSSETLSGCLSSAQYQAFDTTPASVETVCGAIASNTFTQSRSNSVLTRTGEILSNTYSTAKAKSTASLCGAVLSVPYINYKDSAETVSGVRLSNTYSTERSSSTETTIGSAESETHRSARSSRSGIIVGNLGETTVGGYSQAASITGAILENSYSTGRSANTETLCGSWMSPGIFVTASVETRNGSLLANEYSKSKSYSTNTLCGARTEASANLIRYPAGTSTGVVCGNTYRAGKSFTARTICGSRYSLDPLEAMPYKAKSGANRLAMDAIYNRIIQARRERMRREEEAKQQALLKSMGVMEQENARLAEKLRRQRDARDLDIIMRILEQRDEE